MCRILSHAIIWDCHPYYFEATYVVKFTESNTAAYGVCVPELITQSQSSSVCI